MNPQVPRLRMFAGPNGSGKSCFNGILPNALKGVYLNPDELERQLKEDLTLNLSDFSLDGAAKAIWSRVEQSSIHSKSSTPLGGSVVSNDKLEFQPGSVDSYLASSLVEAMRIELTDRKISLTFETVMSHPSKVEFLYEAKAKGYRTYLYYIATESPEINISRVDNRVELGGHPVPKDKIKSRYFRSLELLYSAIKASSRAYIFDNSNDGSIEAWIAEITEGRTLTLKTASPPHWFETYVIDKATNS